MSFSNVDMRLPQNKANPKTPHIALIAGWWRVSPIPKRDWRNPLWIKAHEHVYNENQFGKWGKRNGRYLNRATDS